jgi:hypothetical protein
MLYKTEMIQQSRSTLDSYQCIAKELGRIRRRGWKIEVRFLLLSLVGRNLMDYSSVGAMHTPNWLYRAFCIILYYSVFEHLFHKVIKKEILDRSLTVRLNWALLYIIVHLPLYNTRNQSLDRLSIYGIFLFEFFT